MPPNSNPTMTGDGSTPRDIDVDEDDPRKKMFFTTTDLIERMNSAMRRANIPDDSPTSSSSSSSSSESSESSEANVGSLGASSGGFELHARMPDGSYRPARRSELAAADFQSKMRQATEAISGMDATRKLEWAGRQRHMGNSMFAGGEYKEAMDVYLTCLVAVDRGGGGGASTTIDQPQCSTKVEHDVEITRSRMEEEIQLPVLLNLALCAMKMGMPSKAEKFCNFAIDETTCGKFSPKAHFRRGRARLLMGRYPAAESDLDTALRLLSLDDVVKAGGGDHASDGGVHGAEVENMRAAVLREKRRLHSLVERAERNENAQKRAMERLFGSSSFIVDERGIGSSPADREDDTPSLYPEKRDIARLFTRNSVLRDEAILGYKLCDDNDNLRQRPSYFQWYLCLLGRCAQKLLDLIGDEEGDGPKDPPSSNQINLAYATSMMKCKKDA